MTPVPSRALRPPRIPQPLRLLSGIGTATTGTPIGTTGTGMVPAATATTLRKADAYARGRGWSLLRGRPLEKT